MMVNIIMFCLMGAVFANPISFNFILESNELDSNSTESLSVSQSSENATSELQSSEEITSNQSQSSESESESESESLESTSEDKTSDESKSLLDEDDVADFMAETRDNAMGSEENVRKSWLQVFASVIQVLSAEDNSSAEVKGQSDHLTEKEPTHTVTGTTFRQGTITNLPLVGNPTNSNDTASDSADTSKVIAATNDSSESSSSESNETSVSSDSSDSSVSTSSDSSDSISSDSSDSSESPSSESNETSETSETSDSSDASKSAEESNASDSAEQVQIKTSDCVNGTQSCESDEYLFQDIGDDAHYPVDSLMMPDENERELILRR